MRIKRLYLTTSSFRRHCLSPYGEACYECALSKGDSKGVPLVERNETESKQTQASSPFHVVPASSGGYGQQHSHGYGQPQQGHGHRLLGDQSQSYNRQIYPQNWQASRPRQGLPLQQNQGFQFSYNPSRGNKRKRRSTRHRMEKFTVQIPANITSAQPILRLVPVLSEFNGTFNYVIVHGNTSLFKVEQHEGISFLHVKTPIYRKGVFRLWIKGVLHERKEKKTEVKDKNGKTKVTRKTETEKGTKENPHPLGYNAAKKFSLRLVIKAV